MKCVNSGTFRKPRWINWICGNRNATTIASMATNAKDGSISDSLDEQQHHNEDPESGHTVRARCGQ